MSDEAASQPGTADVVEEEAAAAGTLVVSSPCGEKPCYSSVNYGSARVYQAPTAQPTVRGCAGCAPIL